MQQNEWKVLIIEDEPDSLALIQTILDHRHIASHGVRTAEEALEIMDEVHPTLLIIDLALPHMDGWGFLQHLRENPSLNSVPKVAITAFHTPLLAAKAISAGFDAFIPKPIDVTSFIEDLDDIVKDKI